MFALNEKVVYPGHGVAFVKQIVEKTIGTQKSTFYELSFLHKEVIVLVPTQNADIVGIRSLESKESIEELFKHLAEPVKKVHNCEFNASNWNKRNKEYQLKFRTGKLKDLSDIYKDLRYISTYKELSFGEKSILQQTEALLVEEISLVQKNEQEKIIEQLRLVCSDKRKQANI